MTMLKPSLWRRIVNTWRHSRRKLSHTIDLTPDGFVFSALGRETAMKWSDIDRIDAGVRDCLTYDVLYFQIYAGKTTVYIEELDDGFRQFENAVLEHWPQIRAKWEELSRAEAFQAQHHTLWRRDG